MTDHSPDVTADNTWSTRQVYGMAVGCLLLGLVIGYLFRGSESLKAPAVQSAAPAEPSPHPMPSMEQMKAMGDKQAAPLLAKLKADPNNAELLAQVGNIYKATHQFQEAENYYQKSVKADPRNSTVRGDLAACLYYTGDIDGAIAQLQESLKNNPKDANSLFNLGVMKWQGKKDAPGAVAAWQRLLKSNPDLEESKKNQVQQMIADVGKGSKS
ncbi:MAG TPA: tetratricopeptide repeat protein [Terriglobales bacterium]|nr:tetratricopeptide repeat protein [Terriglobales bacterium]